MQTKAKTAEDLIGIVPHTLGYVPQESLVAIIVGTDEHGLQTCATTLRVDFDLETAAHIVAEGGQWFSRLITGACTATGVFLVLYDPRYLNDPHDLNYPQDHGSDSLRSPGDHGRGADPSADVSSEEPDWDDEYPRVHRDLIRAAIDEIALSLGDCGIDTLSAWWVSEGRFGRIDDDGASSTGLEAASASACATELVAAGSSPAGSPQELVVGPVSAAEFADRRGHLDGEWLSIEDGFDVLSAIYPRLARLREGEDALDHGALAELMTLQTVMAIDSLLVEKWSRDAFEMILSFDHPNFTPEDMDRCRPGKLHLRAWKYAKSPQAAQHMVGLSPRAPRPRDVQLGIEFLKTYIPLGHPDVRAAAYAVIAWFEWSLGGSTMAEHYARAGLALDSENSMASLVLDAVEHGYLPRWLMSAHRDLG
ncbi:DUF4192 family protein [Brevibacterium marinum]|uniref:DUF4192 family protein n=1 Tax=Brevibacterium marinum TaxID=418643 RepID=A0A846RZ26_9MICO|nr:DUF4192 family protein [Brevibacterium marinum]NJC57186.1 hypothetical protein [Brevibacterium marinum]